jgi:MFS family permease
LLGVALGMGLFGSVFGPVLGALAALTSREAVFSGVAALAFATLLWSARIPDSHAHEPSPGSLRKAFRDHGFLAGLGLMVLPAFLFGVVQVLGPLHLDARGWGAVAIGGVWLVSAVTQAALSPPLGRMSDRHGPARPIALLLVAAAALFAVLALVGGPIPYAIVMVAAGMACGGLYVPAFSLLAQGAERSSLAQGLAFAGMNGAWSVGAIIGPAAGGALAESTGDRLPFLIVAGICAATLAFAATRRSPLPAPT